VSDRSEWEKLAVRTNLGGALDADVRSDFGAFADGDIFSDNRERTDTNAFAERGPTMHLGGGMNQPSFQFDESNRWR
jgi:hypothetical protein